MEPAHAQKPDARSQGRCILVFARHGGWKPTDPKPTAFTADRLRPLVEETLRSNSRMHVIHERMATFPMSDMMVENFETVLETSRIVSVLKAEFREQRIAATAQFRSADLGVESDEVNEAHNPVDSVILKINYMRHGTIVNHLNFYTFEAIIENTRTLVHGARAKAAIKRGEHRCSVEQLMKSDRAAATALVIRDTELARQALKLIRSNPGETILIPRGSNHAYMTRLFEELGIAVEVEFERRVPNFSEEALVMLLGQGLPEEEHRRLALLQVLFTSHLAKMGDAGDWNNRAEARRLAFENYEAFREQVFG